MVLLLDWLAFFLVRKTGPLGDWAYDYISRKWCGDV